MIHLAAPIDLRGKAGDRMPTTQITLPISPWLRYMLTRQAAATSTTNEYKEEIHA